MSLQGYLRGKAIWRASYQMAVEFRNIANRYGGDVIPIRLPNIGIKGNRHFPFSDLNSLNVKGIVDIAEIVPAVLQNETHPYY